MDQQNNLIPVDVLALVEDHNNASPIVLLNDRVANRLLPIWIGDFEARAIDIALNSIASPRPLTHRLLLQTIESMGGKLSRVVVDRLEHATYYSSVCVQIAEHIIAIDSRPSDAIALALEARVPIFVARHIMDSSAQANPFPGFGQHQTKREVSPDDAKKMKELLEKAREREQAS